jgi:hypothetical protein
MDRKVFDDGVEKLLVAFPALEMTAEKSDLWYECIKDELTDADWKRRVKACIAKCIKTNIVLGDVVDERGLYQDVYFRA